MQRRQMLGGFAAASSGLQIVFVEQAIYLTKM
jgi:hypothetical protein